MVSRALVFTYLLSLLSLGVVASAAENTSNPKHLAYLVSDLRIPFWQIMERGIRHRADALGYRLDTYSADNDAKSELEAIAKAVRSGVDGIILSPTNSSAAVTVLKLAEKADIPVVISDIGTERGKYVTYIESDNEQGAYELGKVLVNALNTRGWSDGSVGIIAIPQRRANGQARTEGFMRALGEANIKTAGLYQQENFSFQETYDFTRQLIANHRDIRAIWLQGSDRYGAALDAIRDLHKIDQILLICFDAEPEFLEMIRNGTLAGAGMQQPRLMGQIAVDSLDRYIQSGEADKKVLVPVLPVSLSNIDTLEPIILRNVLGQDAE